MPLLSFRIELGERSIAQRDKDADGPQPAGGSAT